MDFTETGWHGVDGIYLAQVRDQLLAVANPVTHLQVHKREGISSQAEYPTAFQGLLHGLH
jgi:hypothetical protein